MFFLLLILFFAKFKIKNDSTVCTEKQFWMLTCSLTFVSQGNQQPDE
jgi:hypothetical protein